MTTKTLRCGFKGVGLALILLAGLLWGTPSGAALVERETAAFGDNLINERLSAPFEIKGDVTSFAISPDSSRVVYRADQYTDDVFTLCSVSLSGGYPTTISGSMVDGGDVADYKISPDSDTVVFTADKDTDNVIELYSAPIDGSSGPTKLNGTLASGSVSDYQIGPDSDWVVYKASQDTAGTYELYSVPINGSASPTKLNGTMAGDVQIFEIGSSCNRVAYLADQDTSGVYELYSVPIDGSSGPIKLNDTLVSDGDVGDFKLSQMYSDVVYRADQDTDEVVELYLVPISGIVSPTKLSGLMVSGGNVMQYAVNVGSDHAAFIADRQHFGEYVLWGVNRGGDDLTIRHGQPVPGGDVTDFILAPNNMSAVYRADQDTDNVFELYYTTLSGSVNETKLSGSMASGGDVETDFDISQDNNRVVFRADRQHDGEIALWSVPVTGTTPAVLNDQPVEGGNVAGFQISDDSSTVAYLADQETDGVDELYSASIDGSGSPAKLNGSLPSGGDVSSYQISGDSSAVVYIADQAIDDVHELYSVPIDGSGAPVKLNRTLASGDVEEEGFQISPDGSTAVYVADQDTLQVDELYSVPVDGSADPIKLSGTLVAGGNVRQDFVISPDSSTVVFRADKDTDDQIELYSVPSNGSSGPVKLNGSLPSGGSVWSSFKISPDGATVVYRADQNVDEVFELYSVPIDGSSIPIRLNPKPVSGGDVTDFEIGSYHGRVVYQADQDTDGVNELYSVPIGGGSATKLNGTMTSGGDVSYFRISPDGRDVVYKADQDTDDKYELYSVPVGGGTATKISGSMQADRDVRDFKISPDSDTVVFRADRFTDEVVELYSIPIDGSHSASTLNDTPVTDGDVGEDYGISPDSNTVVYRADQDTDDKYELYGVPISGNKSPIKLNPPLSGGQDVYFGFEISPDSAYVVFCANTAGSASYDLWSVPLAGGMKMTLNDELPSDGSVWNFAISPDSSTVVYRGSQDTAYQSELYSVPIAGGSGPVKLNGALVADGDVEEFLISADSRHVVYVADQDIDDMIELYVTYEQFAVYLPLVLSSY